MDIYLAIDKNADQTGEIDFLKTINPATEGPWNLIFDEHSSDLKSLSYRLNTGTTIVAYKSPTEICSFECGTPKDGDLRNALQTTSSVFAAIQRVSGNIWRSRVQSYYRKLEEARTTA